MDHVSLFAIMPDGTEVHRITLCADDISCSVLTYGGTLQALHVPGADGDPVDVVLGFDTLEGYQSQPNYIGALVGRYANRIANGRFVLNGEEYCLHCNDGANHLHGGKVGFDKRIWNIETLEKDHLTLSLLSPDGEEGYPGTLKATVTYQLSAGALSIHYQAISDRDTLCNLTNHAYFNLSGHDGDPVTDQELQIFGDCYTPTDGGLIPLGELAPVEGTPMDLRRSQRIGAHMFDCFEQLTQAGGYDHNWAINGPIGQLRPAARAYCPATGIVMDVETTLPGIQLYVSNFQGEGFSGKENVCYLGHQGFCLETQFYPDSPNRPHFPSPILRAGALWQHQTVFRFSTKKDPVRPD